MSSDPSITVEALSKCYHIYNSPQDRFRQFLLPPVARLLGRSRRQYYQEFWALRHVSFEIQKGDAVGVIGRNGSGKSTLLQLICGTLNPTQGDIRTVGRVAALLELGSGFNPEFSGRDNVYMNGALLGLSKQKIEARFDDIASFADIGTFIEQPTKTYSSGMMVRLAFAVAINVDADILIIDEALAVGDEVFQRKCFSRIEAMRSAGTTILFVSHSGSAVIELCDRAILMDRGENLAMGSPKHIVGRYQKLLYAPVAKREAVRDEILQLEQHSLSAPASDVPAPGDAPPIHGHAASESFDPDLKPTTSIEYESHGAHIETPVVLNLAGEPVNNLVGGGTYIYRYTVRFSKNVSRVRFGMLIKTTSGLELGGGESGGSDGEGAVPFEAGASCRVEFRFQCALNPGVYFLNAGVFGEAEGNTSYLHRIIDAAMFRVLPGIESFATGVVDFSCFPEIEVSLPSGNT